MCLRVVASIIICFSIMLSGCEGSGTPVSDSDVGGSKTGSQVTNESSDTSPNNDVSNNDTDVNTISEDHTSSSNDDENEYGHPDQIIEDPILETDTSGQQTEDLIQETDTSSQKTDPEENPYDYESNEIASQITVDKWQDSQVRIQSYGDLIIGTKIRLTISDSNSNTQLESLTFTVNQDNAGHYVWPKEFSDAVNVTMSLVRAGEMASDSDSINTLKSQYRNRIFLPDDTNLVARLKIISVENSDINIVTEKITQKITKGFSGSNQELGDWFSLITDAGQFSDISYPNNSEIISDYNPVYQHLDRLLQLAIYSQQLVRGCNSDVSDCLMAKDYQNAAISGLNFYIKQNYQTNNWWLMHIGFPKRAVKVLFMLAGHITNKNDLISIISYLSRLSNTDNSPNAKGANLADYAYAQMFWSLSGVLISESAQQQVIFSKNFKNSMNVFSSLSLPESRENNCEGIQLDFSFSQHCVTNNGLKLAQLYSGSYGVVQMSNIFEAFSYVASTTYEFDSDAIKSLESVLIDGYGWMTYSGRLDPNIMGRAITRNTAKSSVLSAYIDTLIAAKPYRYTELAELKERIDSHEETNNQHYLGNRYFWTNDYMTQMGNEYFSSIRMSSTRTVGTESGNGEGLKNYYMGQGTHFILKNGNEYDDIQPVWDWRRLPGTTVDQGEQSWPLITWGKGAQGQHDFVGGVSNGSTGVATMQYSRMNIENARKSLFHASDIIVALGSNIRFPNAKGKVLTSIEQSNWTGDSVTIGLHDGSTLSINGAQLESYSGTNIAWVEHNQIRYEFPKLLSQNVHVQINEQSGSWSEINQGKSTQTINKVVFSIWLELDKNNEAAHYQYLIYPSVNKDSSPIILENTKDKQLVYFPERKQVSMVLHTAQNNWVSTPKLSLRTASAAVLIITDKAHGSIQLAYADPSQKLTHLYLELKGEYQGEWVEYNSQIDVSIVQAPLPQGSELGKSAILNLQSF